MDERGTFSTLPLQLLLSVKASITILGKLGPCIWHCLHPHDTISVYAPQEKKYTGLLESSLLTQSPNCWLILSQIIWARGSSCMCLDFAYVRHLMTMILGLAGTDTHIWTVSIQGIFKRVYLMARATRFQFKFGADEHNTYSIALDRFLYFLGAKCRNAVLLHAELIRRILITALREKEDEREGKASLIAFWKSTNC